MNKGKVLPIIYWMLVVISLLAFGFGLRFEEYKVEATLVALFLWVIAYALNRILRNENKKKNQ